MSAQKGLGKGFDSLMPTGFDTSLLLDSHDRVQKLALTEVVANPEQPRRTFDETALTELATSIKNYGVLQPIIVSPYKQGYMIIAGERRWRAAKQAGLQQIPAIVRQPKDLENLEISLIENVQRVDLSPIEQAISIERLHQQFNMTYSSIAERMGKAVSTLNNLVRLLQLPEDARKALEAGQITEGHARAILALKGEAAAQTDLLREIIKNGWSVRQAEQYAVSQKQGHQTKQASKRVAAQTPATKSLGQRLDHKVTLKRTAKGGRLEIHFADDDDLANLFDRLGKS